MNTGQERFRAENRKNAEPARGISGTGSEMAVLEGSNIIMRRPP
jgi:hypothetical protein